MAKDIKMPTPSKTHDQAGKGTVSCARGSRNEEIDDVYLFKGEQVSDDNEGGFLAFCLYVLRFSQI